MKKIWGMGTLLLACGAGLAQLACSSAASQEPDVVGGDPKLDDLIGSVPVNSQSLDGIGSIGFVYNYGGGVAGAAGVGNSTGIGGFLAEVAGGPVIAAGSTNGGSGGGSGGSCAGNCESTFYAQCTGTLVSKNSVLTSRSCGQLFEQTYYGYSSLKFALGADSTQSTRRIDVVDVEYAPATPSPYGGVDYPDIAVLHLAESITDVTPFPVALLTEDLIGKPFAGVGFGYSDVRYRSGARRAGSLTLRGTSGPLYPLIFGSFDAFYAYSLSGGYYPGPFPGVGGAGSVPFPSGTAGAEPGVGGSAGSGAGGFPAGAGNSSPTAGSAGSVAGGSSNDWYREYLQQQYDNVQLARGDSYLGGTDSDAQPCGPDQGGPIVRKLQGKVRVFGVFSRTPFGSCERGGLYASITPDTQAFVEAAAKWTDPCANLTQNGKCVGTNATRCSSIAEGKRRAVKFDCALLNQVCVGGGNTEVSCTDK